VIVATSEGEHIEPLKDLAPVTLAASTQAFGAYIRAETAKWAKVVRESGAKAE
jgi:hypothetical protein